jgi:putative intracellular protease/amidase
MNCQDYEIALGDYVDGTLDERSRIELEAHLASCERCRAVVADFTALRQVTLVLEPELPPAHVWTKLAAAFEAEQRSSFHRWGFTWKQSLAASFVTITLIASLAWIGKGLAPINGSSARLASATASATEPTSVKAEFDLAEMQYTNAIAGLESITKSEQSALDMETADVLNANLTVIDGAITESRAALQTEPDNPMAQESLFDALRSKLELLQDVVSLINEMRKGNPEGAARIVSGLNQPGAQP